MEEWWKAMEDDCNVELRELFQFENVKMKKLVQKLPRICNVMEEEALQFVLNLGTD